MKFLSTLDEYWLSLGKDYFTIKVEHNLYKPKLSLIEFHNKEKSIFGSAKLHYSNNEINKIIVHNSLGKIEEFSTKKGNLSYFFECLAQSIGCVGIVNEDLRQQALF